MLLERLRNLGIGFETASVSFTEGVPTIVMIHGAGGRSQVWQNQIYPMKHSVNALALDLPGHGKTVGQSMPHVSEYARWLGRTTGALFQYPVFLMGHSLGGAIVQETAILFPDLIKGIILAATGPRLPVAPTFLQGLLNNFEETVDTIIHYAYADGVKPSMVKEGARLMKGAGAKVVYDDFLACDRFDLCKDLVNIKPACLIVCGDKDKLTPPPLSRVLNESIKGSTLRILPGAGHMVMIESHEAFNQCVLDFVLSAETIQVAQGNKGIDKKTVTAQ